MSNVYEGAVQDLIERFGLLPGIGPKSAQRLAFFILEQPPDEVQALADALIEVKRRVHFCKTCGNITEQDLCAICRDPRRDTTKICVVEEAKDIQAIERTREYKGLYHVLGGAIDPIGGIGPDQLRIRELMARLSDSTVQEVILATNPSVEGEATATYLARQLRTLEIPVSRLASGLPVGGDLEYADEVTLGRAFEGRRLLA
ncbi:MAG: recombination mediator RecR [Bifidobacteriaceae bacterium]|nr:recombination mediator RecR [Bifidobacteriaceae bacterium]